MKLLYFVLNITFSKILFFSIYCYWLDKLDPNLRSDASLRVFKKDLWKFARPSPNSTFNCHNRKRIKYLTRLRLGLSHLCECKFKYSFQNTLNTFRSCDLDVETNTHFFLYCHLFSNQRCIYFSTVHDIDSSLTNTIDSILTHILLFGKASLDISANTPRFNAANN